MNKTYIYVFTRKDLSASQIAVQSIHSAFELGREWEGIHPSIVLLKVKNSNELNKVGDFLKQHDLIFKSFKEPYYDNTITSITVGPISEENKILFKKFKLLRNHDFKQGDNNG